LKKVTVETKSKSYPVYIGSDIFKSLPELIKKQNLPERVFVIIDKKVDSIYGTRIKKIITSFSNKSYFLSISASERTKSFKASQQIYAKLSEKKFTRDTLIIAIGGGTVGDLAGFIASTYMRGLPVIHIPTTLLAAVDSSVGGKTAINFGETKNLIGTFYQPELVLIDTEFLKSLPIRELISGCGEIIKYSYLTDEKLYNDLLLKYNLILKKDFSSLNNVITECIKIKSSVVSSDEKEISGVRKILNFGHTFAHSFEINSGYKLAHGLAVISGIISALYLSYTKGLINKTKLDQMIELPLKFKSSIKLESFNESDILRSMMLDKKNREGEIRFVLIKNFGEMVVNIGADRKEISRALKMTNEILV
jgi:3-dehydroquinate synthase